MQGAKVLLVLITVAGLAYGVNSCGKKLAPTALEPSETQQAKVMSGHMFTTYGVPPTPEGGFEVIMEALNYPESARKAGIEGRTILKVTVGADGQVQAVEVVRSSGNAELDQAAVNAVKSVGWKPAKANNEPVAVAIHLPVVFRIHEAESGAPPEAMEGPPPKAPGTDDETFVPYDRPPQPIGGFAAIQENLRLPETARGRSGRSILHVLIDARGQVADLKVLKSAGDAELDEAAMQALRSVKWQPATRSGEPVDVWVAIPVIFK